jgi:hypothetical protein
MPGSTRQQTPQQLAAGVDRDATIEYLLLTGLDFYFSGQHERAIHAWTRVLFLDRGHARARAYIDRARRVLAERQREADELLHDGLAAFDEGDAARAREVLTSLLRRGNVDDVALAVLQRMDRLEAAGQLPALDPEQAAGPDAAGDGSDRRNAKARLPGRLALALAVAAIVALAGIATRGWFGAFWPERAPQRALETSVAPMEPVALPLPSVSELVLADARTLFARGHLREALRTVESIGFDDSRKPEADRLRADIQRALIAAEDLTADPGALRTPSRHNAPPP